MEDEQSSGLGNQLTVVVLTGAALLVSLVARFVLPAQFLLDDGHLRDAMDPQHAYLSDPSFQIVGALYRGLGLEDAPSLAALLGEGLFLVGMFAAIGWGRIRHMGVISLAAVAVSLLLSVAYLGQYSKELLTLLVMLLVLAAPRRWQGEIVVVGACLAYGAAVRPYWILVAALYVLWRLAFRYLKRPLALLVVPVLAYAALQPAFLEVLGGGLQSQRTAVNDTREMAGGAAGDVASLIVSPLPDAAGPMGVIAALLMLVLMVVPVPLLLSFSPYHMVSAVLILGIWLTAILPVLRGEMQGRSTPAQPRTRVVARRCAALLLSFLLVQALFEPDFGSCLKHLAPLLPLFLALLPSSLRRPDAEGEREAGAVPATPADVQAGARLETTSRAQHADSSIHPTRRPQGAIL